MADNTEYEQDEVVIVPPQNGGNDGDVSGDGGSGTGGSGGTGGSNGDGGDGGDGDGGGGGDDGGNDDGSGGGDNEGGDGSGGSGSGGSGSGGSGSGGDGGDADGGDREGDDKEGDDKEGDDKEGDDKDGDGEDGEGEDKEGDDDSKKDPLIGKEVMLVYVFKAGGMWTVERKIESHNVTTDEYETNKDLFEERDVKVGDVLTFYSLKKGDEETQLHRMDFVLMGDSVAYIDNNSMWQVEEVEQINNTEGTLNLKKLTIRASDVIKSIPKKNEEKDEDENALPFKVGDRFIIIDKAHETYEVVSINEETESFNYTDKYKGDFTWNLSEAVDNFRTGFCKLLEKPSDPIGKKAIVLFGSDIGDEIEVYGIGEEHELEAEEYAKDKKRWDKLNLAVGDKWYYYTVRSGGVTGTMARFQFAIKGDYVLHKETQYLFVYDKFEKGENGKTEWDAVVGHTVQDDTKTERKISVDKFSRVIPITKEEKKQDENPDEEFESIVMEIINQLKAEFELASAFPSDLREFCRAHFPKSIYDSIKVLKSTNGENAEELGQRGYDMETIREFDSEVAKMMLSYIQTNGYYFSPQTAFNHLLYDAFNKLGVFTFTNTKLNDQNDSTYFVSISNDDGHLTVYSIVPNTFVQKIVFGSTKNIVKFGLWQDRNVTSKKAEDKTKDDYADIDHLYSFLNWVIGIQRKQLEGARVVEHEEINHEIASIYIKQLKALKDATK